MNILLSDDSAGLASQLQALWGATGDPLVTFSCAVPAAACHAAGKQAGSTALDLLRDPSHQNELAATIADAIGQALLNRGFVPQAKALIEQAFKIRKSFLGPDHPATAASFTSRARVARNEGALELAEQHSRAAVAINSRVFGQRSFPVAQSLNELARIQLQRSELSAAEMSASEALGAVEELHLESKDLLVSRLLDTLARVHQARGEYGQAAELYTRALALDLRQVGETHPEYLTHLTNFATVKEAQGNLQEAADAYSRLIAAYEELGLPEHPNRIDAESNLGAVLLALKKHDQAKSHLDTALRLGEQVRGPAHYLVGKDYVLRGRYFFESPARNDDAALKDFATALAIYEGDGQRAATLSPIHTHIGEALTWKGRVLLETRAESPETETVLRRAVSIWNVNLGPDSVPGAIAGAYLGRKLYLAERSNPEARRLLERGYCVIAQARGADSEIARTVKRWLDQVQESTPPDPCR
ncbi:MAG TPA: tetratricopeptide repeat protein [Steroidobacteraceae bacterium]|nr:tetratricopeptide repeat protein [Steroidobacteraceae bacterium]